MKLLILAFSRMMVVHQLRWGCKHLWLPTCQPPGSFLSIPGELSPSVAYCHGITAGYYDNTSNSHLGQWHLVNQIPPLPPNIYVNFAKYTPWP